MAYYYGYKDNRVIKWGNITRSLSDDQGQYVGSEFTWTLTDADRAIRTLLAGATTKYFANRPITVRMITDPGRRALDRPRTVFCGTVRDYKPSSPLTFDFTARDSFDALFSLTGAQQMFPRRTIALADFPQANDSFWVGRDLTASPPRPGKENKFGAVGLPVPIIYGEISDLNIVDSPPFGIVDGGDGQCPAVLVGIKTLSDGHDYFWWVVAGHACKHIHEIYINNDPQNIATDPDMAGHDGLWKIPGYPGWDDEFSHPYEDINGRRYTTVYGRRGKEVNIAASSIASPTVITAVGHGFTDGAYIVIAEHQNSTPSINGIYIATVVDADHFTIDVDVTTGGTGGWAIQPAGPDVAAGVVDRTATSSEASIPFALNVQGIESTGDGTGALILDGLRQYLHCLQNWLVGDYQSGAWLSTPTFPAGESDLPLVDEDSFTQVSNLAKARIVGGYRGDFILGWTATGQGRARSGGTFLSARDVVARFNASFDVDVGFNRKTQFMVSMVDDTPSGRTAAAVAPRLTDVLDVLKDTLTITDDVTKLFNRVPFRHTEDYFNRMSGNDAVPYTTANEPTNWRSLLSGVSYLDDTDSITNYSTVASAPTPFISAPRLLYMVRGKNRDDDPDTYAQGSLTATDVVTRYLNRHKDPPRVVVAQIGLQGMNYELGEPLRLSHFAGIGADGWTDRPLRIVSHEAAPGTQIVTLTMNDLQTWFDIAIAEGA